MFESLASTSLQTLVTQADAKVAREFAIRDFALRWATHLAFKPDLRDKIDVDESFGVTEYSAWISQQVCPISLLVDLPTFAEVSKELKPSIQSSCEVTGDFTRDFGQRQVRCPRSPSSSIGDSFPVCARTKSLLKHIRGGQFPQSRSHVAKPFNIGGYTIVSDVEVPVHSNITRNVEDTVGQLEMGCVIHVVEVARELVDGRVRARIESPAGWISLYNMFCGRRYAVPDGREDRAFDAENLMQDENMQPKPKKMPRRCPFEKSEASEKDANRTVIKVEPACDGQTFEVEDRARAKPKKMPRSLPLHMEQTADVFEGLDSKAAQEREAAKAWSVPLSEYVFVGAHHHIS